MIFEVFLKVLNDLVSGYVVSDMKEIYSDISEDDYGMLIGDGE